jgi:hypothetical protein
VRLSVTLKIVLCPKKRVLAMYCFGSANTGSSASCECNSCERIESSAFMYATKWVFVAKRPRTVSVAKIVAPMSYLIARQSGFADVRSQGQGFFFRTTRDFVRPFEGGVKGIGR